MSYVDIEKAFDIVTKKVMEWAMRKKGLPEFLVGAEMSLYQGKRQKLERDQSYLKKYRSRLMCI